jgi:hypothetical protein
MLDGDEEGELDRPPWTRRPSRARPHPTRRPAAGGPGTAVARRSPTETPGRTPAFAATACVEGCVRASPGTRWLRSGTATAAVTICAEGSPAFATRAGRFPAPGPRSPPASPASGSSATEAPGDTAPSERRMPPRRQPETSGGTTLSCPARPRLAVLVASHQNKTGSGLESHRRVARRPANGPDLLNSMRKCRLSDALADARNPKLTAGLLDAYRRWSFLVRDGLPPAP